jgi:uncharacterized RDD family membrane protein YckC
MDDLNPYAPPQAAVGVGATVSLVLASRSQRLQAFAIDSALAAVPIGIGIAALVTAPRSADGQITVGVLAWIALGVALAILAVQLELLRRNAWSVGKRMVGVRIVQMDGRRAGLARCFLLRLCVPSLICVSSTSSCCLCGMLAAVVFWIPPSILFVLDSALILKPARRCGHDYLANTQVVRAR